MEKPAENFKSLKMKNILSIFYVEYLRYDKMKMLPYHHFHPIKGLDYQTYVLIGLTQM